ncbi:MAG: 23S rRNA (adenine(2503)-C(2))-methyltransferase RlmN [Planctomycetota bacterium]|nr:23S rRNA (adenine(2503)-C(2))-methyltransferase RlmN [Planctomycetota bacterium]
MLEVHRQAPLPHPFSVTHEGYVAACAGGSGREALEASARYTRLFREGHAAFPWHLPSPDHVQRSDSPEGEVLKFLLEVPGRSEGEAPLQTESVIIPMKRRHETTLTLCVSSQVGCAMGCAFCETAQMGLMRSLDPSEIVAQWFAARHALGRPIRNIVFMGMGEPLDNLDNVLRAIAVLTDHRGPGIGMSRITVSTVGRLDGLAALREAVTRPGWRQLNLAVSINAPNDEVRSMIMPINRAMPLGPLIEMLRDWPRRKSGAICMEYVLIPGVNDLPGHAEELAARLAGVRCCVNVIPYNPRRSSPWRAPTEDEVAAFLARLEAAGQFCKRRRTKGRETMAACGQLGNEHIRKRRFVGLSVDGGSAGA